MIDKLWESGDYQTWLETKRTKATVGVHRALIRWSDGVSRDSHLKIMFESDKPSHCLAHEAAAWLLAQQLGLPVPPLAGFLILTPGQIATAHPERPRGGDTVAWVTSTEPEHGLWITESMESDKLLTAELCRWPAVTAACAFDEWLANVDRYPRNLLRRGHADFCLIDHDFIAGGPHWLADMLTARIYDDFRNVLRDRCAPDSRGNPDPERQFTNAMVEHAGAYQETIYSQLLGIGDWLGKLMPEEDRESLLGFIVGRAGQIQNLIRRRYKLLA